MFRKSFQRNVPLQTVRKDSTSPMRWRTRSCRFPEEDATMAWGGPGGAQASPRRFGGRGPLNSQWGRRVGPLTNIVVAVRHSSDLLHGLMVIVIVVLPVAACEHCGWAPEQTKDAARDLTSQRGSWPNRVISGVPGSGVPPSRPRACRAWGLGQNAKAQIPAPVSDCT